MYKYVLESGNTLNVLFAIQDINELTNATQVVITVGSNAITTAPNTKICSFFIGEWG